MPIVSTIQGKCKRCYSCVRNCPAKAIRIREGQAEVIEERCIACGTCVKVCAQKAKQIESHIEIVFELLQSKNRVIAALAPSFPAAFENIKPGQLVSALKKLGFTEVYEIAFGAQLISTIEYPKVIRENKGKVIITSPCPAIVAYIEKYHPNLIENLAPIVSPMICLGRVIKQKIDRDAKVVFIGPCIAKKYEMKDEKVKGVIDAVLTYQELKDMFTVEGIRVFEEEELPFDGPKPGMARSFPISGGLLKSAALESDILDSEIVVTEGKDRVLEVIQELEKGTLEAKFLDLLFCEGCINGPVMDNDLSVFAKKDIVANYVKENYDPVATENDIKKYSDTDLRREFTNQNIRLPIPTEDEIKEILAKVGKTKLEDELNCGACGYNSCREKAVAVYQGLAEVEMCLPYLIDELQRAQESLIQAEKMSSLGQIAAGVAHEINNPLTGVLVYIKLLLKNIKEKKIIWEALEERLKTMEKETERCSRIIKNLLDFSRQTEPSPRPCNLNKKIENALTILIHQAELSNVEIIKEYEENLPFAYADPDQIQQVFVNIILNAIQAMPQGGKLKIKTKYSKKEDRLIVSFTDTGVGISKENMKKLFTPFFTTKEKGKGVGLGLAVCYGIIQRHNGTIEVESEEGKGTTFTVKLPSYKGE
jgi:signal transduction histidine kinase/iron only hydrogenase large subunit-like protein